ncbi:hypothetical protein C8E97_3882 [Saccharothrix australiensis]|uniref:Uncharacterized protein n=1 Tax=Saccharothrix australiensis TaxID=2072 RepID=A0A495W1F3_9PSEU|nr:hypothetical protein C8E97_3882 [Saccharothrix australiensis]
MGRPPGRERGHLAAADRRLGAHVPVDERGVRGGTASGGWAAPGTRVVAHPVPTRAPAARRGRWGDIGRTVVGNSLREARGALNPAPRFGRLVFGRANGKSVAGRSSGLLLQTCSPARTVRTAIRRGLFGHVPTGSPWFSGTMTTRPGRDAGSAFKVPPVCRGRRAGRGPLPTYGGIALRWAGAAGIGHGAFAGRRRGGSVRFRVIESPTRSRGGGALSATCRRPVYPILPWIAEDVRRVRPRRRRVRFCWRADTGPYQRMESSPASRRRGVRAAADTSPPLFGRGGACADRFAGARWEHLAGHPCAAG